MPGPMAEALVQQLNRAEGEPVVLRLRTGGGLSAVHAADRLHAWAQYHQYPILRLRASTAAPTAFGPVRELLRLLLPSVQRESAEVLEEFAPELTCCCRSCGPGRSTRRRLRSPRLRSAVPSVGCMAILSGCSGW